VYFSGPLNYPTTTTIEQVTNSTSEIEKLPQIGDYYQGGIFVGIFNPGTPINSDGGSVVYGNASTGNASDYRARAGIGYGRTGWILIADLENHVVDSDYTGINLFDNIPFMSSNIIPDSFVSSTYDGLYNTIENTFNEHNSQEYSLYNKIRSYSSNGFTDWYLPSQDELALYFKNIKPDTQLFNGYRIPEGSYLSSTLFSLGNQRKFNDTYFNYTQQATTDSYGKVNLLPVTEKAKIKLFRRIYLGSEISNVLEPETCSDCTQKATTLYYKNRALEEQFYKEHLYRIEHGKDLEWNDVSGGWHDCFVDAFIGALEEFENTWAGTAIEALLGLIVGASIEAAVTTTLVCVEVKKCVRVDSGIVCNTAWQGLSPFDPFIRNLNLPMAAGTASRACFQNLADAQKYVQAFANTWKPGTFYEVRYIYDKVSGLPNWIPGSAAGGVAGTVITYGEKIKNILRTFTVGGIGGALARLGRLIINPWVWAPLVTALSAYEIGRLLKAFKDAYECIQIKNQELKEAYERLYGKPECREGAWPEDKCLIICTVLDCTGRLGVLLDEYRKAWLECCKRSCLKPSEKSVYCSIKAIPPDPRKRGTDIITPMVPGRSPLGRELLKRDGAPIPSDIN
jgi:hypothetical protein